MNLTAIMPVRNEAWVLGMSARAALLWCDSLVLLDHASTDATPAILRQLQQEYGSRVTVLRESGNDWLEMAHRQRLLEAARESGATHIAIVDADEILTGNLAHGIRDTVAAIPPGACLHLPGYNLRGSLNLYHANGIWGDRWFSVAFADDTRLNWAGDRFHHREPMGLKLQPWTPIRHGFGGVMHLWGASERRLRAKHAHYKMVEALRWPGKSRSDIDQMYSLAITPAADKRFDQQWMFRDVPAGWWAPYAGLGNRLRPEAEPWQESDCQRMIEQHGGERFDGLDLFGVCSAEAPCSR